MLRMGLKLNTIELESRWGRRGLGEERTTMMGTLIAAFGYLKGFVGRVVWRLEVGHTS